LRQSLVKARWLKLRLERLEDPGRQEIESRLDRLIDEMEKRLPDEDRRPR